MNSGIKKPKFFGGSAAKRTKIKTLLKNQCAEIALREFQNEFWK